MENSDENESRNTRIESAVRDTFREAARNAAPPPDLTITQWAEQYRVLGHSSRLAGPYRVGATPYWREPMDALSPRSDVQTVVVMKGAQLGASEFMLNVLGYHMHLVPSPILAVQPTIEMARRFSRQRLAEMLALTPALTELTAVARGGELPASQLFKATRNGAALILTGANSPSSLRSLPARIVLLDEVDAYPGDVGGEGDPCDLAMARTESYGSSKRVLLISTPTEKGLSRIERLYEATDKRRYYVPCPQCGTAITLEFEQLKLANFTNSVAIYRCQACGEDIQERDKLAMIEAGSWKATAGNLTPNSGEGLDAATLPADVSGPREAEKTLPPNDGKVSQAQKPTTRGYHLSQLYSPWTSWADILDRAEAARGIPEKERVFQNTGLGLTWGPPALEVPEAEVLMARAEPYGENTVPAGGAFLTAGVDVQADRLECEIVAWGRDFESWSVHYQILYGDISEPEVWNRLDEVLTRTWPHVSNMPMQIQAACIDSGFSPAEVTQFTRHRHGRRIYATKGASNGWGRPIWPRKASWDKNKHAIYLVSSDEAKSWVANRMRIDAAGAGYMHTPMARERGWYEQMTAEKLTFQKGQKKWVNPMRARNEAFDARALNVAALHSRLLAGVDLNNWCEQFEAMLAPPPAVSPIGDRLVVKPNGAPPPPAAPSRIRSRFVYG